jgi:hypothetical protein
MAGMRLVDRECSSCVSFYEGIRVVCPCGVKRCFFDITVCIGGVGV